MGEHARKLLVALLVAMALVGGLVYTAQAEDDILQVPWRTQFDGTTYASSNCGPAALGMAMAYFDEWWSSAGIRRDVNNYLGYWGLDGGSTWEAMAYAAQKRGFYTLGLYDDEGLYYVWTIDDLMYQVRKGRPVLLLVRYQYLPGHEGEKWWGDHYIVFLGLDADGNVVYHDSTGGPYMVMSQKKLLHAWRHTAVGLRNTAMSLSWVNPWAQ